MEENVFLKVISKFITLIGGFRFCVMGFVWKPPTIKSQEITYWFGLILILTWKSSIDHEDFLEHC